MCRFDSGDGVLMPTLPEAVIRIRSAAPENVSTRNISPSVRFRIEHLYSLIPIGY